MDLELTDEQHAFARAPGGALEHWWWTAQAGIEHDTWGNGIVSDPTSVLIGAQQHVALALGVGTGQGAFGHIAQLTQGGIDHHLLVHLAQGGRGEHRQNLPSR